MDGTLNRFAVPSNPWSSQEKSLSGLRKALALGERTGHIAHRTEYEDGKIDSAEEASLPSLKLIKVLKEMSQARSRLNKINLEIQNRMQDKETADITHLNVLEKRIAKLRKLTSHIESVIDSKDRLIGRLQQPFQGDYLKIEAQYHRFAGELFPQITPLLAELTSYLENIVWNNSLSFSDGRLDTLITVFSSALNTMQTNFQSYYQIHQSMGQLHDHQTGVLHSTHLEQKDPS